MGTVTEGRKELHELRFSATNRHFIMPSCADGNECHDSITRLSYRAIGKAKLRAPNTERLNDLNREVYTSRRLSIDRKFEFAVDGVSKLKIGPGYTTCRKRLKCEHHDAAMVETGRTFAVGARGLERHKWVVVHPCREGRDRLHHCRRHFE